MPADRRCGEAQGGQARVRLHDCLLYLYPTALRPCKAPCTPPSPGRGCPRMCVKISGRPAGRFPPPDHALRP